MLLVTYRKKFRVASDIYSFEFSSDRRIRYTAGQFIELTIPHESDDRGQKRWFTLSSSPSEDTIVITTKIQPHKSSTFKQHLLKLKAGTELKMANPMGDFVLPKDPKIPLVFVAGGIGCTPFRSIIKYLQDSQENRDIKLLYSVSDRKSAAFLDLFNETLGGKCKLIDTSVSVRLDSDTILGFSGNNPDCYYYLSGPEQLVESLEKSLFDTGIEKNRLHGDFFPGYETT